MPIAYLGREWGRQALATLRSDPRVREAVAGLNVSVLTRITGAPEGRYAWLYATFDDGQVEGKMGKDDTALADLPEPAFTITGPYEVFAAIQRGEMSEHRAFLSGQLHVEGNRLKALRLLGPLSTVTGVLAQIECQT